ncbi:hypothetical protein [Dietzia sp. 179-F 9C3 NHS]|uniref:hypothetical protein n=1 Tax=Dietzia sp. 179-F 9C3 NHS TaxID=3374295 RepID=UPI0038793F26
MATKKQTFAGGARHWESQISATLTIGGEDVAVRVVSLEGDEESTQAGEALKSGRPDPARQLLDQQFRYLGGSVTSTFDTVDGKRYHRRDDRRDGEVVEFPSPLKAELSELAHLYCRQAQREDDAPALTRALEDFPAAPVSSPPRRVADLAGLFTAGITTHVAVGIVDAAGPEVVAMVLDQAGNFLLIVVQNAAAMALLDRVKKRFDQGK